MTAVNQLALKQHEGWWSYSQTLQIKLCNYHTEFYATKQGERQSLNIILRHVLFTLMSWGRYWFVAHSVHPTLRYLQAQVSMDLPFRHMRRASLISNAQFEIPSSRPWTQPIVCSFYQECSATADVHSVDVCPNKHCSPPVERLMSLLANLWLVEREMIYMIIQNQPKSSLKHHHFSKYSEEVECCGIWNTLRIYIYT